jgi:AraC-like DNA-binding protein
VFYLVGRGTARLEVPGERTLSLSVGDVVFLPHGSAHVLRDAPASKPVSACDGLRKADLSPVRLGGQGATTTLIAGFYERTGGRAPALLERIPRVVLLSAAADAMSSPWLPGIVQLILAESAAPGLASALVLQRLADVLFVQMLRALTKQEPCKNAGLPALADPVIHEALALIHTRVAEPWTVATLASKVRLSRSGFAARFNEVVGEPPLQYLARWRVARAAELLRDTPDDVGEIASRVGYASIPSFNKAFKRWQGMTPSTYRQAHPATTRR